MTIEAKTPHPSPLPEDGERGPRLPLPGLGERAGVRGLPIWPLVGGTPREQGLTA